MSRRERRWHDRLLHPSLETLIKLILLSMGVVLTIFVMGMRLYRDYDARVATAYEELEAVTGKAYDRQFANRDDLVAFVAERLQNWTPLVVSESDEDADGAVYGRVSSRAGFVVNVRLNKGQIWDGLLEENRLQLVLAFLTLIASVQIASLLAYSVTSPLQRLAWGFMQLTSNRSVRLPKQIVAADELVLLTDAFNDMAEKLDRWHELQGRVVRMDRLAALGEMVSGIAHEIRNPLASMRIHLDLLYNDLAGEENARNRERLTIFEEEIGRMERKLNLFLDFAKHRSNRRERIDPNELLHWVTSMLGLSARERGISLCTTYAEAAADVGAFYGDPDEMRQAILNLALNGIQAMGDGGVLTLSAEYAGGALIFSVEDTGGGIPEEVRERLMEPFVTSRSDGTGLGLSITRKSAEDHGGHLDYTTSPGGSRFFMTMPLYASKEAYEHEHPMDR